MLPTLDRDVTGDVVTSVIVMVLPLTDRGWTLGTGVHAPPATVCWRMPTHHTIIMPDSVTVSVHIFAIAVLVDWRPLVLLSSGLIGANGISKPPTCCSDANHCDCFAAS